MNPNREKADLESIKLNHNPYLIFPGLYIDSLPFQKKIKIKTTTIL